MLVSTACFHNNIRTDLRRIWNNELPILTILMYYPSTADEVKDDTTISRIISIAKYNNYGGIIVLNTETEYKFENNIQEVVVAWGNKLRPECSDKIISKLRENDLKILCFGILKNGNPSLPTRLPIQTIIKPY